MPVQSEIRQVGMKPSDTVKKSRVQALVLSGPPHIMNGLWVLCYKGIKNVVKGLNRVI